MSGPLYLNAGNLILSQRSLRISSILFILFLYSAPQQLFPPFYLPGHLSILLPQLFSYWFLLEYFQFQWLCCLLLLFFIYSRSLLNVLNVYFISAFYFQDFGKVMTMLFNTLSRIFIAILPRKKCHNFVTAVTIHSDFGAQEGKIHCCFNFFPIYLTMKWWDRRPWSLFFECWVLCQLFHSPLTPSSRSSLVPLHFNH